MNNKCGRLGSQLDGLSEIIDPIFTSILTRSRDPVGIPFNGYGPGKRWSGRRGMGLPGLAKKLIS